MSPNDILEVLKDYVKEMSEALEKESDLQSKIAIYTETQMTSSSLSLDYANRLMTTSVPPLLKERLNIYIKTISKDSDDTIDFSSNNGDQYLDSLLSSLQDSSRKVIVTEAKYMYLEPTIKVLIEREPLMIPEFQEILGLLEDDSIKALVDQKSVSEKRKATAQEATSCYGM